MKTYIKSQRSSTSYKSRNSMGRYNTDYRQFNASQKSQIQEGLESGIDVSVYADPKFTGYQMEQIRLGLKSGVDVSVYADPEFEKWQMVEIRKGLENGIDVSVYADPKFNYEQMIEIRQGLQHGVDVSVYADPKFDQWQMLQIRVGLEDGVDASVYADPQFDWKQMREIREGLELGLDISWYADPKFDGEQMDEIGKGLESGLDVSVYADPKFDWAQMGAIRRGLKEYANDPLINQVTIDELAEASRKNLPSLAYLRTTNKYQKAKLDWQAVKDAASSRKPLDVPALEEEFDLVTLEGRAAYTLGLKFDENPDGSITFFYETGAEMGTISSTEFDNLVRAAIVNSSTRQSFAKAFATQLKREFDL